MITQINAIDVENVYERKLELEAEINKIIEEKDLDLFLLVVTDIINSNSDVLALGKAANNVEKAFEVELLANRALLEGDRKSTRLNSSHVANSYAVFCLNKK